MDAFKVPQAVPQDLLLIQELIGVPQPSDSVPRPRPPATLAKPSQIPDPSKPAPSQDNDISSSGEENDSEDEIAEDLITGAVTDEDDLTKIKQKPLSEPSESTSDSSDSDSDPDSSSTEGDGKVRIPKAMLDLDLDEDEDPVPAGTNSHFTTKHEVLEVEVPIPEVDEVGSDEILEKVGEVMNIVDNLVIVRGLPADSSAGYPARSSDRALDSDTLLVFDDRKVMGYTYETFGPTTQPFYQVKFNTAFPLDPERVRVGREVFHVPTRSRFVFVNQIKVFKGSDASNVHDEEPADDELEFSDDEAEAAHRSRLKRKRGESRARSVASSRQSTPNPTLMRDQDLADDTILSRNAYDEHGPYDIDCATPGPSSRPAPIPYDDPYGDYTAPDMVDREAAMIATSRNTRNAGGSNFGSDSGHGGRRGEEKGYERRDGPGRDRGRERTGGRGRERGGRGRGRGGGEGGGRGSHQQRHSQDAPETYERRPLSPTSLAIARATGQAGTYTQPQQQPTYQQHSYGQQQHTYPSAYPQDVDTSWGYAQMASQYLPQQMNQYGGAYGGYQQQNQAYQHQQHFNFSAMVGGQGAPPFVQPHINPRFASAFGLGGLPQVSQAYRLTSVAMSDLSSNRSSPAPSVASSTPNMGWAATTDEWAISMQHSNTPGLTRPGSVASGSEMDVQK